MSLSLRSLATVELHEENEGQNVLLQFVLCLFLFFLFFFFFFQFIIEHTCTQKKEKGK